MENIVIVAVIAAVFVLGIASGRKHFKGEGGCCGGGSVRIRKKLTKVIGQKTVVIEGMMCENCESRVERFINEIDGAAARANYKKKVAVVSLEKNVSDEAIRAAVEKAGYRVTEIRPKG